MYVLRSAALLFVQSCKQYGEKGAFNESAGLRRFKGAFALSTKHQHNKTVLHFEI
jgi:hypothetical protein